MSAKGMVAAAAIAIALGGCMNRGAGSAMVTGSIPQPEVQRSESEWRALLPALQRAYDQNRNDRAASMAYARALRAVGQNQQAVAVLQNVVMRSPEDLELNGAFGRALMDAGQLQQADEVLSRAHLPERPDWRILSAQGAVADQLGDHARAQGLYETALRINPGEPTVLSNLGLSYALARRLPEAERVLTQAAGHPRADKRVRQNLMLVYGLQGRFADAERIARADLPPAEAEAAIRQLRQMNAQPNSWDAIRRADRQRSGARAAQAPAQGAARTE